MGAQIYDPTINRGTHLPLCQTVRTVRLMIEKLSISRKDANFDAI